LLRINHGTSGAGILGCARFLAAQGFFAAQELAALAAHGFLGAQGLAASAAPPRAVASSPVEIIAAMQVVRGFAYWFMTISWFELKHRCFFSGLAA
jgi:hypothetical protein